MAAQKKVAPEGVPPAQQAAAAGESGAPRVSLTIDGGPRGEEYRFHFEASAGGAVAYRFKSELSGHQVGDTVSRMESVEFDRLLRALDPGRLRAARRMRMPPIPPCSLVGQLEVFDGRERVQVVFMADAEQAKQAGYRMPVVVARAVERIYTLAARQLGVKTPEAIRP
jgi:hypothetical protein